MLDSYLETGHPGRNIRGGSPSSSAQGSEGLLWAGLMWLLDLLGLQEVGILLESEWEFPPADVPVESLRLRFALLQSLNTTLETFFLPLVELRQTEMYGNSIAALLQEAKGQRGTDHSTLLSSFASEGEGDYPHDTATLERVVPSSLSVHLYPLGNMQRSKLFVS